MNAQIYYPFKFNFVQAPLPRGDRLRRVAGAARAAQAADDPPRLPRARCGRCATTSPTGPSRTTPTASPRTRPPTLSRRGLVALAGGASALTLVMLAGQSIGGPLRKVALLAPRRQEFPVNKTAAAAGVTAEMTGERRGGSSSSPATRGRRSAAQDLLQMPQRRESLPIACVEGWSTTQTWTGVRIADLARAAGHARRARVLRRVAAAARASLREATLSADQIADRAVAAGAAGRRRGPLARPRLPGAGDRPGAAGRAQHEVGREDDVPMRARYGASPLHLRRSTSPLFAAFAWVALQVADAREAQNIVLWFVAAIVLHDLVLLPFYSAIDRVGCARPAAAGAAVNHVRIPAALSALLFLLFFPPILGRNEGSFARVAGVEPSGYLERWLLVTAALFAASALLYVVSSRRAAAAHSAS